MKNPESFSPACASADRYMQARRTTGEDCAVATGSLPVSAAEILRVASAIEDNASTRETLIGSRIPVEKWEAKALREAAAMRYCANVLKRHSEYISRQVEYSNKRQPEENTQAEP